MRKGQLFLLTLLAIAGIYGCVKTPVTKNPASESHAVADYFDDRADEGIFDEFAPEELAVAKELLEQMNIKSGDKLAEAGCGAGRLTEMLAELVGPEGKVFAFDISPRMVERCRQRGLPSQVEIACASATRIPVGDGEFDVVVCHNTFPHFEDKLAALREFHRVLREGGVLWIVHSRSREWVNSLHSSIGGVLTGHVLPDRPEFERLLHEAGFSLEFLDDLPDRFVLKAIPIS